MKPSKIYIIAGFFSLIASLLLALYGREEFYFWGIVGMSILIVATLSLSFSLIFYTLGKLNHSSKYLAVSKYSTLLFFGNLIMLSSFFIWSALEQYDTQQARIFCNSIIVKLEKYKMKNSKYPSSINEAIQGGVALPLRLHNYNYYKTDGQRFRIIIPIIGPNSSGYVYESTEKKWTLIDFIFEMEAL